MNIIMRQRSERIRKYALIFIALLTYITIPVYAIQSEDMFDEVDNASEVVMENVQEAGIIEPEETISETVDDIVEDQVSQNDIENEDIAVADDIISDDPILFDIGDIEIVAKYELAQSTEPAVEYFDVPLSDDLQDLIFELCEEYEIDPTIIIAMIKVESRFDEKAVSGNGQCLGLMQINPKWHQDTANALSCPDLMNPYHNVTVGIYILNSNLSKGKGIEWALMAYNGGPSYANKKLAAGNVSNYAKKVLQYADELGR